MFLFYNNSRYEPGPGILYKYYETKRVETTRRTRAEEHLEKESVRVSGKLETHEHTKSHSLRTCQTFAVLPEEADRSPEELKLPVSSHN